VHVTLRNPRSLLAKTYWPAEIQWPIAEYGPDFELLDRTADTPPGCEGLRQGGDGNWRTDYYIDPQNDSICVKTIQWKKRGADWAKASEIVLSDFRRIAGRAVARTQTTVYYDDPAEGIYGSTYVVKIDLEVISPADYPPGTFDPETLTTGATMRAY
jgi:hypothetical protein